MKTLIVFGTTYGYAKESAQKLAEQLEGEVVLVNAMTGTIPSIKGFDSVIIGGSIYMGQIQKKIKEFCITNNEELSNKRLGLFLCCGLPENLEQSMKNAFPERLLEKAVDKECFGGELRINKMKFMHKMLTNMMLKATEKEGKAPAKPITENISKLAEAMNRQS